MGEKVIELDKTWINGYEKELTGSKRCPEQTVRDGQACGRL